MTQPNRELRLVISPEPAGEQLDARSPVLSLIRQASFILRLVNHAAAAGDFTFQEGKEFFDANIQIITGGQASMYQFEAIIVQSDPQTSE